MKNVHVLPTDKPSRLWFNDLIDSNELILSLTEVESVNNQHIYITSDEEIKDVRPHKGKWQLEKGQILNKFPDYLTDLSECKLVIMTTDQDLIAGGVQAIDDEFLEWFVKNPSCEEVDVEDKGYQKWINPEELKPTKHKIIWISVYKIIIPQEEPKQETLNKINNMNEEIKKQINLLEEEQTRVKQFINENNFNCTTAPYVIAKQYRDEIKKHIGILKMNLEN